MLILVERHGEGLTAAVVDSINQSDLELLRMLSQVVCSRHAWEKSGESWPREDRIGVNVSKYRLLQLPPPTLSSCHCSCLQT